MVEWILKSDFKVFSTKLYLIDIKQLKQGRLYTSILRKIEYSEYFQDLVNSLNQILKHFQQNNLFVVDLKQLKSSSKEKKAQPPAISSKKSPERSSNWCVLYS